MFHLIYIMFWVWKGYKHSHKCKPRNTSLDDVTVDCVPRRVCIMKKTAVKVVPVRPKLQLLTVFLLPVVSESSQKTRAHFLFQAAQLKTLLERFNVKLTLTEQYGESRVSLVSNFIFEIIKLNSKKCRSVWDGVLWLFVAVQRKRREKKIWEEIKMGVGGVLVKRMSKPWAV